MRVICPNCQKTITLADSLAGQSTTCPECAKTLTAPTLMAPETAVMAQPVPPPPTASAAPPTATAAQPDASSGHNFRVALSEKVLRWVGPAALVVLFFATFFTWVGSYSGSYAIFTQSAWGAAFGTFTTDGPIADKVLGMREVDLKAASNASPALIFAILFLLFILPVAIFDIAADHFQVTVPDALQIVWPHRMSFVLIGSALIFLLLSLQLLGGIGLENTAVTMAERKNAPAAPETTEQSTMIATEREIARGIEVNRLGIKRKCGLCVGYWASIFAVAGFGLEMWMQRRGNRQAPAIEVQW